jgi:ATP-binding cassette subfamily F protein 3
VRSDDGPASRKAQRRRDAEMRAQLQPLRKRLRETEARLEQLTAARAELEHRLADPALYADDSKPRLLALLADKQRVDAELEQVEVQWLEQGEALEQLQADAQANGAPRLGAETSV